MKKTEELTNPQSCMSRAEPDEMTFVLLARDMVAPTVIRDWCARRVAAGLNTWRDSKINEALACAAEMDRQYEKRHES